MMGRPVKDFVWAVSLHGVRQMQVRALRELRALLRSDVSWHGRQLAAEGWAAAI